MEKKTGGLSRRKDTEMPQAVAKKENIGEMQVVKRQQKVWTSQKITFWANIVYFLLIIFQVPLFRVSCRAGICTTPIQVTSSQLIANEIFPSAIVKGLLYPGAVARTLVSSRTVPSWGDLFDLFNLTDVKNASPVIDLQRLEILAGSYFAVAGSLVGLIKPGRMILFGTLLIIWGLVKEAFFGKAQNPDPAAAVYVYPTIMVALISAFLSITYSMKKAARSSQPVSIAKPVQSSAKSKLR